TGPDRDLVPGAGRRRETGVRVAVVGSADRPEYPGNVQTSAALGEERAHRVPQVVVARILISSERVLEHQLVSRAVGALELLQAGDDLRYQIDRAIRRRSNEAGRRRAHSLDRLGAKR